MQQSARWLSRSLVFAFIFSVMLTPNAGAGAIDPLHVPEVLDEATFLEATETLNPSEAQQAFLVHAYEQYAADYELMRQQRQPWLTVSNY